MLERYSFPQDSLFETPPPSEQPSAADVTLPLGRQALHLSLQLPTLDEIADKYKLPRLTEARTEQPAPLLVSTGLEIPVRTAVSAPIPSPLTASPAANLPTHQRLGRRISQHFGNYLAAVVADSRYTYRPHSEVIDATRRHLTANWHGTRDARAVIRRELAAVASAFGGVLSWARHNPEIIVGHLINAGAAGLDEARYRATHRMRNWHDFGNLRLPQRRHVAQAIRHNWGISSIGRRELDEHLGHLAHAVLQADANTRVPRDDLRDMFHTSRTVLREGWANLRFVAFGRNRGAPLANPSHPAYHGLRQPSLWQWSQFAPMETEAVTASAVPEPAPPVSPEPITVPLAVPADFIDPDATLPRARIPRRSVDGQQPSSEVAYGEVPITWLAAQRPDDTLPRVHRTGSDTVFDTGADRAIHERAAAASMLAAPVMVRHHAPEVVTTPDPDAWTRREPHGSPPGRDPIFGSSSSPALADFTRSAPARAAQRARQASSSGRHPIPPTPTPWQRTTHPHSAPPRRGVLPRVDARPTVNRSEWITSKPLKNRQYGRVGTPLFGRAFYSQRWGYPTRPGAHLA